MARIETDFYRANPLRSIADYSAELDAADLRKQSLQQNALALQDRQRGLAEQDRMRNALSGLSTDEQRLGALRGLGTQGGFTAADALEKSLLERKKTGAEVRSKDATSATTEYELRVKQANQAIADISALSGPEEAAAGIQQKLKEGVIDQQKAQALLQSLPQDPAQFGQWQRKMLMGILDAKDRLTMTAPKIAMQTAGGQVVPVQTNPDAGPIGQMQGVAPIAVTQTPDNAATNARAAADAAASRGVQLQIARMTDERVKSEGEATRTAARTAAAERPLPEGAQKQVVGARNLKTAVDGYLKVLEGWNNAKMVLPDARAEMGNAYNNMMLQAKEAYNLGVLNGPDYTILQSVVKDPTKWTSALTSNEALGAQAKSLRDIATGIERTSLEAHGKKVPPLVDAPKPGALPAMTPRKPLSAFGS